MKAGRTLMDLGFWCLPPAISHRDSSKRPAKLSDEYSQATCLFM